MRFRSGMVATVMVVTGVTMGVAFAGVSAVFNQAQEQELDRALLDVAREEAREAPGNGFRFSDRPGPAANDVGPLTKFGIIYGATGRPVSETEPFDTGTPLLSEVRHAPEQPFDYRFASRHLRCVLVPIPNAMGRVLFLAASREDLDGDEAFLNRAMLAAFVLAVAWAGLLATWMVRRQVRHHESLAGIARRVASGDLEARVNTSSTHPDIAQLGRDIDAMIEQLSSLMSAQQRFIAHAAHELRSPLATLYGELQQALRKPRDVESYRATVEQALLSARRLNQLAEDLLTLARPQTEDESTTVVTEEIVANAVGLVGALARSKQVRVDVEVDGTPVLGRARDLERMLRNLIENAVEHAPCGDLIRVAATGSNGIVRFSIEDHGPGVPTEECERIFEPFYRSGQSRAGAPRGAGLGLAIAREIARAHGGDVHVEATTRKMTGGRFVAVIPCAVLNDAPQRHVDALRARFILP